MQTSTGTATRTPFLNYTLNVHESTKKHPPVQFRKTLIPLQNLGSHLSTPNYTFARTHHNNNKHATETPQHSQIHLHRLRRDAVSPCHCIRHVYIPVPTVPSTKPGGSTAVHATRRIKNRAQEEIMNRGYYTNLLAAGAFKP